MDSSNMNSSTPTTSNSSSHQDPLSPSPSFFDPLPAYLPTFRSSSSSHQPPRATAGTTTATSSSAAPTASKKRSRSSRRAPTTVLTTDPTNFRAMVQEFTGFPSPPFLPRPLLDPAPSSSSYLSTPFPHNITPPSLVDAIASTIITRNINAPPLNDPNPFSYPFFTPTTLIGAPTISSSTIQLPAAPQFGDLGSLLVSPPPAGLHHRPHQQVQLGGRVSGGALPGWQDQFGGQSSSGDRDHDHLRPDKRQKSSDAIEPWLPSSHP